MGIATKRTRRSGRRTRGARTRRVPGSGLEYLECYVRLDRHLRREVGAPGDPDEDAPIEALWDRIAAYEAAHVADPLVALAQDPRLDALDLALLRILFVDRVRSGRRMAGVLPLALLRRAGVRGLGNALREMRRLLPGSPLLTTGLVEVGGKATHRLASRPLLGAERLLTLVLGGSPVLEAVLGDGCADPDFGLSSLFDESEAEGEAPGLDASTTGDLVLPPAVAEEFERVVRTIQNRERALAVGLGEMLPSGKGVAVLLSGPPGCGKTQAVRVLARRLGRPLHLLSCADVLDKFVGETERRIRAAFRRATETRAVLCFDEADALLAARDRMEHHFQRQMVSEFLVGLDRFDGVACFATNALDVLDEAFERRFAARIVVPRPGRPERLEIWRRLLPSGIPRADDVDLEALANADLSGGEIRNAVLAAVTEAVAREPVRLTQADLEVGLTVAAAGRWSEQEEDPIGFARGVQPK